MPKKGKKGKKAAAEEAARLEAEQKAKEARARANSAGKKFQAAKDDACSTRIGGKILCVRYGVGY